MKLIPKIKSWEVAYCKSKGALGKEGENSEILECSWKKEFKELKQGKRSINWKSRECLCFIHWDNPIFTS